jgi:hypothetical protein
MTIGFWREALGHWTSGDVQIRTQVRRNGGQAQIQHPRAVQSAVRTSQGLLFLSVMQVPAARHSSFAPTLFVITRVLVRTRRLLVEARRGCTLLSATAARSGRLRHMRASGRSGGKFCKATWEAHC